MTYTVVLLREADGGFVVQVPALRGCWTQGDTVPEALDMAKDAIRCHLGALAKDGVAPPEDVSEFTVQDWAELVEAVAYRVEVGEAAQVA